jgi:hypothetical protein
MKLVAEIAGEPPIEITWKLNGQSLEDSKAHKVGVDACGE